MRFKLSNIATRNKLEEFADAKFRYSKVYKPKPVYTGLEEELLPIIIQENQNEIDFGIWGILPDNYQEDWEEFQNTMNTLAVFYHDKNLNKILTSDHKANRCVILVTGFFTNFIKDGVVHLNYVYAKNKFPFYLAGYYNILNDGFITVTVVLKEKEIFFKNILNNGKYIPKVLNVNEKEVWLSKESTSTELDNLINETSIQKLHTHPIAKELFQMNIFYESILQPIDKQSK